jgi:PAS domain S-box-containing protein
LNPSDDALVHVAPGGAILACTPAAALLLGHPVETLVGLSAEKVFGALPAFDLPFSLQHPRGRARGFPGPDGTCWITLDADGPVALAAGIRRFADALPLGVFVWRLDVPGDPASLRFLYVNETGRNRSGVDWGALVGRRITDVLPSALRSGRAHVYARLAERGGMVDLGVTEVDGPLLGHLSVLAFGLPDRCVATIGRWETDRIWVDTHLRDAEDRFRSLFETIGCGVAILDRDLRMLEVNQAAARMLGQLPADFVGRRLEDLLVDAPSPGEEEARRGRLPPGTRESVRRRRFRHRNGSYVEVEGTTTPIVREGVPLYLSVFFDVTALRDAEEARRASDERFESAFEHAPIGIGLLEPDGTVRAVNRLLAGMLGRTPEALAGVPLSEIVADEDLPLLEARLVHHRSGVDDLPSVRFRMLAEHGRHRFVDGGSAPLRGGDGSVTGFVVHAIDLTEQLRLEEEVRRVQRFETLGRIAGGVAHDFNNIFAIIRGAIDLLGAQTHDLPKATELLGRIDAAALRATDLTRQLTILGRHDERRGGKSAPGEILEELRPLFETTLGEAVTLRLAVDAETPSIRMAPSHLEQLLLSLAVNAREAMPQGGLLSITARPVTLRGDDARTGRLDGEFVEWQITDNGGGMRPEVAAQAFEPFFTTKTRGRGAGLGLAIVQSLVAQASGHVELRTAAGAGTTVFVYLPADATPAAAPTPEITPRPGARGQTLLLCEDEPELLEVFSEVLEHAGYRVHATSDPRAAIRIAEGDATIDALITDVVMPGMRGTLLAAAIRRRHPNAPVLFVSGYSDERGPRTPSDPTFSTFLAKPFRADDLVKAVDDILR